MGSSISNVLGSVQNGVKQILFEINPTINKFEKSSLNFLNNFENEFHVNLQKSSI